jgi:hypothetical protein
VGRRWFADNSSATNSGMLVLRATTDKPGAELEIDVDGFSASNNTAIDLPQPSGGWKANITETEFSCFYDTRSAPAGEAGQASRRVVPVRLACQAASASPIRVDAGARTNGQISSAMARQFAVAFSSPSSANRPRLIRCKIT